MEYYLDTHKIVYNRIKNVLSDQHLCKNFQQVLLSYDNSQRTWESLAEGVENYVAKIRNLLPLPQLVQVFLTGDINYITFPCGAEW